MEKVSWTAFLSESYDLLWKLFIRPPRSEYLISDLGPSKFRIHSRIYCREDFHLTNGRGMRLACSIFGSYPNKQPMASTPCVIYLHGNCSSRAEALDVLQVVLEKNFRLCCMDLSGSGQSEGEFISLGHFEQLDLQVLIQHLRNLGARLLGLWGRSMGAVTAILRAAEDSGISALVLDSPFSNLPMVAQELVQSQVGLPDFLVSLALSRVRTEIQERAHFDIQELLPIRSAPRARSPALFAVADDDDFVLPHHTHDLHAVWGTEAKLVTFQGGHNGPRPKWYLEQAADFLEMRLVDTLPTAPSPGPVFKRLPPKEEPLLARDAEPEEPPPPPPPPARREGGMAEALTAQLMEMGFSQDIAQEAAKRFPSGTEDAMEWALEESTRKAKESAQAIAGLTSIDRLPCHDEWGKCESFATYIVAKEVVARDVGAKARTAAGDAGIGGQATVRRMVDAPVGVAGLHGLLCFTSLADGDKFETPPLLLLPISFLEAVRSIIDLGLGELRTPGFSVAGSACRDQISRNAGSGLAARFIDFTENYPITPEVLELLHRSSLWLVLLRRIGCKQSLHLRQARHPKVILLFNGCPYFLVQGEADEANKRGAADILHARDHEAADGDPQNRQPGSHEMPSKPSGELVDLSALRESMVETGRHRGLANSRVHFGDGDQCGGSTGTSFLQVPVPAPRGNLVRHGDDVHQRGPHRPVVHCYLYDKNAVFMDRLADKHGKLEEGEEAGEVLAMPTSRSWAPWANDMIQGGYDEQEARGDDDRSTLDLAVIREFSAAVKGVHMEPMLSLLSSNKYQLQEEQEVLEALGLLTRRLAEPKRPRPLMRAETAAEVSPQVEAASAAAGRALESKLAKLAVLSELTGRRPASDGYPGDTELVAQLLGLGFSSDRVRAATERCSTVRGPRNRFLNG
ncbi:yqkD [Symbiodinium microadriaticum]|nr:yqkD [Symbiodinium microadriaticum]